MSGNKKMMREKNFDSMRYNAGYELFCVCFSLGKKIQKTKRKRVGAQT